VDLEDFYEEVARTASQELLYNDILRALKETCALQVYWLSFY